MIVSKGTRNKFKRGKLMERANLMSEYREGIKCQICGNKITREDAVVIVKRVMDMRQLPSDLTSFEYLDSYQISDYAIEPVNALSNAGLINGYNGMFNPKMNLSRAEATTILYRLLMLIK